MRVVFDTNIFVSLFAYPGGQADEAFDRIITGKDWLFVSVPLLMELSRVLAEKFKLGPDRLAQAMLLIEDKAVIVRPTQKIKVLSDEPDNRILECGLAAKADVIVTGDKAMLKLKNYMGIRIISLREYLELT